MYHTKLFSTLLNLEAISRGTIFNRTPRFRIYKIYCLHSWICTICTIGTSTNGFSKSLLPPATNVTGSSRIQGGSTMEHWQARVVYARQGLYIPDCPSCVAYRACYQYRVILPPLRCTDPHALPGTKRNQTTQFSHTPQLGPLSHGLPICPDPWGPWGDRVWLYQSKKHHRRCGSVGGGGVSGFCFHVWKPNSGQDPNTPKDGVHVGRNVHL